MKSPTLPLVAAALLVSPLALQAATAKHFYSHYNGKEGAVASLEVQTEPPAFGAHPKLFGDAEAFRLTRLRMGPDGRLFGMNEHNEAPWILAIDASKAPATAKRIPLADRPTELRTVGPGVVASGHRGMLHLIDPKKDAVVASWTPPADIARVTDFSVMPDASALVAVARQDTLGGGRKGHRVLIVDLPAMKLRHDLPIPRDQPNVHYSGASKDNGPGPLFTVISPESNTLLVGLNTYGAILLADLDAALKGAWKNVKTLPTSKDGAWGVSFPGSAIPFAFAGRQYALVSNASQAGGSVLVDLAARKILQHLDTAPHGMIATSLVPGSKQLVIAHSGIEYFRGVTGIEDKHVEPSYFTRIDLAPLENGGPAVAETIPFPEYTYDCVAADPAKDRFWILAVRNPETADLSFVLYDIEKRAEVSRIKSLGVLRNFVPAPAAP